MDSTKEDFSPIIWEGVIGGRYLRTKNEYRKSYQGLKFFFIGNVFIVKSVDYRYFIAIDSSRLKNIADIFYKAYKLSTTEKGEKSRND